MRVVPALDRGLRILELLAAQQAPMRVADIAQALSLPRSATYELIHTLAAHQVIHQHLNGQVALGPRTRALGNAFAARIDFAALAIETVQRVTQQCNETAQIGVLEDRDVRYVAKAESQHASALASSVGARLPAHCTALGKMLLALLPPDELSERLASRPLEQLTARSMSNSAELRRHLDEARIQHFAWEESESNDDVACVAAPVFDAQDVPIAALSIAIPCTRMNAQRRYQLRLIVTEQAQKMSMQLGAPPKS